MNALFIYVEINDGSAHTLESLLEDAGIPKHFQGFDQMWVSKTSDSAPCTVNLLGTVPTTPTAAKYNGSTPQTSWPNTMTITRNIGYTTPVKIFILVE